MRLIWFALVACSDPARPPVIINTPPPPAPVTPDPACAKLATSHRVVVPRDTETALSRDGRGVYRGTTIDHFADGHSETVVSLELYGSPWMPDARDRAYHPFGDHCIRLVAVGADQVELEIALQASHAYDAHRCHVSCCAPGASRAPDGSEECCFCSDQPSR